MSTLSVIIPAYNAAPFLAQAVLSLVAQRRRPDEVVIVNDASTDGTRRVLERLRRKTKQFAIIAAENAENLGGGATRNRAVALAKGDYLFCLDADNLLLPDTLHLFLERAEQARAMEGRPAVICSEALQFFRDRFLVPRLNWVRIGKRLGERWEFFNLSRTAILTNPVSPASSGNYLYHREIFERSGGYAEDCGAYDAWVFGVRNCLAGYPFLAVPGVSYLHRLHPRSYWEQDILKDNRRDHMMRAFGNFRHVYTEETFDYLQAVRRIGRLDWSRLKLRVS
ncbi:MAG: glycosyltransferase family 2 protein [Verrucomicrobiae bacterium]|nr:glycosyltransferase family 2 protein [Verrucomicrobiae bacterium]